MNRTGAPPIVVDNVGKRYGKKTVLTEVSLNVDAGECLALVGHNGAGKTTLLKLLLGVTRPTSGNVRVFDRDPADPGAAGDRGRLGFLPESVAFQPAMTGLEVLKFYARLKGLPANVADGLLEQVGLTEAGGRRVGKYSKGMRQRLGLAQAVLDEPELLLFDEPTSGLDPGFRRTFYDLMAEQRKAGKTSVISSHALTEIEARADRIAIMHQGRLVACDSLAALRAAIAAPIRVRITATPGDAGRVANGIGPIAQVHKVNDRTVELTCPEADKMSLMRRLAEIGPTVDDVELHPPMLEEIFDHFTGTGGRP